MLLGSFPESGAIPSTFWTNDKMLLTFCMLYNFISFFFMLNFIIAIICESYVVVSEGIKSSHAHQEFFHDCVSVVVVFIKSCIYRYNL
jgi:hypothetical protein